MWYMLMYAGLYDSFFLRYFQVFAAVSPFFLVVFFPFAFFTVSECAPGAGGWQMISRACLQYLAGKGFLYAGEGEETHNKKIYRESRGDDGSRA